jgi:phosphatidylglycerol:prolipoprotein diacylglycerol transferase
VPAPAVITISLPPDIDLGPVSIAWHGLTIAIGIGVGATAAGRWARRQGLDPQPLLTLTMLLTVAGIVGGRLFYLLEHGGPLLGTRGYTFDGGFILAALVLLIYVLRTRLDVRLLDVVALWLPLGVAIGRVGDVINGEHYGDRSDLFLAVRNSHPDALTPDSRFAYENGGLYEVLLALLIFAVIWPLRHRLPRPGDMAWLVLGLFACGRFFEFFLRSDSPDLALGLSNAQWTSVGLLVVAVAGRAISVRVRQQRQRAESQ